MIFYIGRRFLIGAIMQNRDILVREFKDKEEAKIKIQLWNRYYLNQQEFIEIPQSCAKKLIKSAIIHSGMNYTWPDGKV